MEQNIGPVEVETVHAAEPLGEALTGLPRDNLLERPPHRRLEPSCSEDGTACWTSASSTSGVVLRTTRV